MMKPITESLWWLAAGCTMLHLLWVGGVIGLLGLAGRRILCRASWSVKYGFALCCLLVLVAAPAVVFVHVVDRMRHQRPEPQESWAAGQEHWV